MTLLSNLLEFRLAQPVRDCSQAKQCVWKTQLQWPQQVNIGADNQWWLISIQIMHRCRLSELYATSPDQFVQMCCSKYA